MRSNSKILITGSSGLVGGEVVDYFASKGFMIFGIDNNQRESFFGKNGLKWYAKCDGCCNSNSESILNKFRPHFQCLSCGKIDRLNVEMKLPKVSDQKVSVSQLLIQGRCESCN